MFKIFILGFLFYTSWIYAESNCTEVLKNKRNSSERYTIVVPPFQSEFRSIQYMQMGIADRISIKISSIQSTSFRVISKEILYNLLKIEQLLGGSNEDILFQKLNHLEDKPDYLIMGSIQNDLNHFTLKAKLYDPIKKKDECIFQEVQIPLDSVLDDKLEFYTDKIAKDFDPNISMKNSFIQYDKEYSNLYNERLKIQNQIEKEKRQFDTIEDRFRITNFTIEQLKELNLPEEDIKLLQSLRGTTFANKNQLEKGVLKVLSEDSFTKYFYPIVLYSRSKNNQRNIYRNI